MNIVPVFAQAAGGGASALTSILPLVLIFVVFYFLLIRPQQKKVKQHKAMVEALRRGDRVVTGGGMIGTVSKVINDTEVQVEISEGVRVRIVRSMVQEVLSKTEPVSDKAPAGKAKGGKKGSKDKDAEVADDGDSADSKS
ncbi:preprotein translocase subunit YajC [Pelagibius sp. Alg239-R121]|uniref:preprotein translocase subunit YajC n=1 Tax=Pelagibius sp. Alg239-R121 TaxID=2993448 RepID=UPI0024A77532|nr:preprotein translocase subunit YajC [Pelagibius sp. Alg239-R121]